MKKIICKKDIGVFGSAGEVFWYETSDFMKGCWHIYVSDYKDAWLFNIFSEKEFNEHFEPCSGQLFTLK